MTLFIALGIVLGGSTAVLLFQYLTKMLADPHRPLEHGRDQWNTKR